MKNLVFGGGAALLLVAAVQTAPETRRVQTTAPLPAARLLLPTQSRPPSPAADPAARPVLDRCCVTCHNDKLKTGGLSLQGVNIARAAEDAEVLEKAVRKLGAGAMP